MSKQEIVENISSVFNAINEIDKVELGIKVAQEFVSAYKNSFPEYEELIQRASDFKAIQVFENYADDYFLSDESIFDIEGKTTIIKEITDLTGQSLHNVYIEEGGGIKGSDITITGKILAGDYQIFFDDLIMSSTKRHLYNAIDKTIEYGLTTTEAQTIRPEWFGANNLSVYDRAWISEFAGAGYPENKESETLLQLYLKPNNDAFVSMDYFLANNISREVNTIELKEDSHYVTAYQSFTQTNDKLFIDGNNATLSFWGLNDPVAGGNGYINQNQKLPDGIRLTANAMAGENKVNVVDGSQYQVGDRVFLGSWSKFGYGWPPSMKNYSYHMVVNVEGNTITLDRGIEDSHFLTSPYNKDEIGKPALYTVEGMNTFFKMRDVNLTPSITSTRVRRNKGLRTLFHMRGLLYGGMEQVDFLKLTPHLPAWQINLQRKGYSYPSNGMIFEYNNFNSNGDLLTQLEVDKNITAVYVDNGKSFNLTGNTGVKRLYVDNSQIGNFHAHANETFFSGANEVQFFSSWIGKPIIYGGDTLTKQRNGLYYGALNITSDRATINADNNKLYIDGLNRHQSHHITATTYTGTKVSLIDENTNKIVVSGITKGLEYYSLVDGKVYFVYEVDWDGEIAQDISNLSLRVHKQVEYK